MTAMAVRKKANPSTEPTEGDAEPGLTLDELVSASGVPARTIRFYQAERLLPKPDRDPHDGRVARYAAHHAETLDLIGQLRDRGLKLPAIRELLREGNSSERVAEWLGLDATLRGAWAPRTSRVMSQAELDEFFEDCPPGTAGLFQERHLLQRMGDGWIMTHADLADLTVAIVRGGVEPELVLDAGDILREHLSKAADQLMNLFADAWSSGFGSGSTAEATVATLRPVAGDAARLIFANELERSSQALLSDTKRLTRR